MPLRLAASLLAAAGSLTTCARAGGCAASNYPFLTLKERDNETGLDYFGARYYASVQGRFTSADNILVDQAEINPQSWNLYTYSGNSPAVYTDPFGLWKKVPCSGVVSECWQAEDNDTYETLVRDADLGLPWKLLEAYFWGQPIKPGVTVLDISGFEGWVEATLGVKIVTADEIPGDRYTLEIDIGPPLPGGSAIGRSGKRPAELVKRLNELRAKGLLPKFPTSLGWSNRKWGQIMRWGTGSAEARARIQTLTKEELQRAGITREMAEAVRDFYKETAKHDPYNVSAQGRAELMQRAVDLLK